MKQLIYAFQAANYKILCTELSFNFIIIYKTTQLYKFFIKNTLTNFLWPNYKTIYHYFSRPFLLLLLILQDQSIQGADDEVF